MEAVFISQFCGSRIEIFLPAFLHARNDILATRTFVQNSRQPLYEACPESRDTSRVGR